MYQLYHKKTSETHAYEAKKQEKEPIQIHHQTQLTTA